MQIEWRGDEGFWGTIHVASCRYDPTRPKGSKATHFATVHLPAGLGKVWTSKRFDSLELGRGYCQRLATDWVRKVGLVDHNMEASDG